MIYGIGTDIVEIDRIAHILDKNPEAFIKRILNQHEQDLYRNRAGTRSGASYVAKRFAAKEAFAKALGTGIGRVVGFQDLTIRSNDLGKPHFHVSEKLRLYLVSNNIKQAHLSLSDEKNQAIAFVVIEKNETILDDPT